MESIRKEYIFDDENRIIASDAFPLGEVKKAAAVFITGIAGLSM